MLVDRYGGAIEEPMISAESLDEGSFTVNGVELVVMVVFSTVIAAVIAAVTSLSVVAYAAVVGSVFLVSLLCTVLLLRGRMKGSVVCAK
jgi:hypothetical protein